MSRGVRTFEDLLQRCAVDEETGCVLFGGKTRIGRRSTIHIAEGILDDKPHQMLVSRAAWLLSGRKIPRGMSVYRKQCECDNCINPDHHGVGKANDRGRAAAKRGVFNTQERLAQLTLQRKVMPAERVRQIEEAINSGRGLKEVAAEFGHHVETISRINRRLHPAQRAPVLPGASVFSWGAQC